jgi:preprotein translocase subunit SecG
MMNFKKTNEETIMKKTLVFAATLFFAAGFLVSCSKKDRDKIINGGNQTQNIEAQIPNDTMEQGEKQSLSALMSAPFPVNLTFCCTSTLNSQIHTF